MMELVPSLPFSFSALMVYEFGLFPQVSSRCTLAGKTKVFYIALINTNLKVAVPKIQHLTSILGRGDLFEF